MVLIMDSRRGMTDLDQQMIEWFSPTGRPIHVLLTKCDKLNQSESRLALKKLQEKLKELNPHGPYTAQLFSSTKRIGLVEADAMVSNWLGIEASAAHTSNENRISKNLKPQLLS
jgi:GTP-binding protein